jgi:SAM-dependent methyltransferase
MNERDFHDHHYGQEAAGIFDSPIFSRVHERSARDFLRATGAGPQHRILSLGCGDGSIERRLARHVGEIIGMDVSAVAIDQAREKSRSAGLSNVTFLVSAPEAPRLDGLGEFDVVAAFAFLHHLEDAAIDATLRAAKRALRPGGTFYSSDPSRRRLVGLFTPLVRRIYDRYHSPDERELDPESLAAAATQAGFAAPAIRYTDYFLGPLAWLAPGTPGWLAVALQAMDDLALRLPLVRTYASSFNLLARAP